MITGVGVEVGVVGMGVGPLGGSLMVSVLTEGLPRAAPPVGVPRVNVSVWLGPGSGRSVPVMSCGGLPDPERQRAGRDAAVAVPEPAVPPSVNGTVMVWLTSLTVPSPSLAT